MLVMMSFWIYIRFNFDLNCLKNIFVRVLYIRHRKIIQVCGGDGATKPKSLEVLGRMKNARIRVVRKASLIECGNLDIRLFELKEIIHAELQYYPLERIISVLCSLILYMWEPLYT